MSARRSELPLSDAAVISRISTRFSADGTRAACVAGDDMGRWYTEAWDLPADGARLGARTGLTGDPSLSCVLPVSERRLLLSWHASGGQSFALVEESGRTEQVGLHAGRPLRLLPVPETEGCLAIGVAETEGGGSVVCRVECAGRVTEVLHAPGRLTGGAPVGRWWAFTLLGDGAPTPVLVDPGTGALRRIPVPDGAGARVLTAGGGRVLLAVETQDGHRLAMACSEDPFDLHHLPKTPLPGGNVHPVAVNHLGRTVAFLSNHGAANRLALLDWSTADITTIAAPVGRFAPTAAWTSSGLWMPYSSPTRPSVFAQLGGDETSLRLPEERRSWAPGRLEIFPGPAGPVEALIHGPDWRTSARVVVALHGGASGHWPLAFNRLFQRFADAGLTVIAPNQRGSTGYGAAHTLATVGAWGGPDLDDVRAVGAAVRAGRSPGLPVPALYGTSYGAFLAVLTAAVDDHAAWSSCVAVSPFLSGRRLRADGSRAVSAMVAHLAGDRAIGDELGPRDLLRLAPRIGVPLMLIHGALDETVPVSHSRGLAGALTTAGLRRGRDFVYHEVPDGGHHLIHAHRADPLVPHVMRFLTQTPPA